jgi:dihydroxy-acid dehydratase
VGHRAYQQRGCADLLPLRIHSIATFSQDSYYDELDREREVGCIRHVAHAFSADGRLAIDNP